MKQSTKSFTLKEFKGKANIVEEFKGKKPISTLWSYGTKVAVYDHNLNKFKFYRWFSLTTGRHINAFLEFYGHTKMTKKQILSYEK